MLGFNLIYFIFVCGKCYEPLLSKKGCRSYLMKSLDSCKYYFLRIYSGFNYHISHKLIRVKAVLYLYALPFKKIIKVLDKRQTWSFSVLLMQKKPEKVNSLRQYSE